MNPNSSAPSSSSSPTSTDFQPAAFSHGVTPPEFDGRFLPIKDNFWEDLNSKCCLERLTQTCICIEASQVTFAEKRNVIYTLQHVYSSFRRVVASSQGE